jgi:hypothetical protein
MRIRPVNALAVEFGRFNVACFLLSAKYMTAKEYRCFPLLRQSMVLAERGRKK